MNTDRDYFGEKLRLVERAREDAYFRRLDEELIDKMRQRAAQEEKETGEAERLDRVFTPILIPVDFSSYSTQALLTAADVAERFGSSLIVLHVIPREIGVQAIYQHREQKRASSPGGSTPSAVQDVSDEEVGTVIGTQREQTYAELQSFLPPRLAKYPLELRVVVGRPFERIVETAVNDNISLIVMGTHGRTGLSRVAMGSVAERVVRLAPCPVLTVKGATPEAESWLQEFYSSFMAPRPS